MEFLKRYSDNLNTGKLVTVMEEYSRQHPEYWIDRRFHSSGHVEGSGGSSEKVIELRSRNDNETLVRLTDYSAYQTDSSDFFDNSIGGTLTLFCGKAETAHCLYDTLSRLAKLCIAIRPVNWQPDQAMEEGSETTELLDSIEPKLLETMKLYITLGDFDVEACIRIMKEYRMALPLSEVEISNILDWRYLPKHLPKEIVEHTALLQTVTVQIQSWSNSAPLLEERGTSTT